MNDLITSVLSFSVLIQLFSEDSKEYIDVDVMDNELFSFSIDFIDQTTIVSDSFLIVNSIIDTDLVFTDFLAH